MHKVQTAYNENLKELQSQRHAAAVRRGLHQPFSASISTIGVNGLVEAAEFMGIPINDNRLNIAAFVQEVLGLIEHYNRKYRTKELMFNCEMIPAENVGVKHAKWDREDGYVGAARLLQLLFLRRGGRVAEHHRQVPAPRPQHTSTTSRAARRCT